MKNLKKFTALMLVGAMTLGISGCKTKELPATSTTKANPSNTGNSGGSTELMPEDGAKLLLWTDKDAYGKALAEGFMKKYPGVTVTTGEFGSTEQAAKIELDGPAGNGADVFFLPHDKLSTSIESGILLPIQDQVAQRLHNNLLKEAMSTVSKDGVVYGVPVSIETIALFYNKDIVDKPVKTFEELFDFAKTFNDPPNNKFAFVNDMGNGYNSYAFFTPYGFDLFGKDGTDADNPGFDSDAFIKGLEFVQSLNTILPVKSNDLGGEFVGQLFKSGKAAYTFQGPWSIEDYKKENINFGVTTIPTVAGNSLHPFAGVQMAGVSAYSDYPDAATLLAEFLASPEGANILYKTVYKLTSLKDLSVVEGLSSDEVLPLFAQQFKTSFPMPSISRVSYYWSISGKALSLTFNGEISPQEASKRAMDEWNSLVASE